MVATSNPCPCGFKGDHTGRCQCDQASIGRYQRKLSGPLLDRIDIVTEVARVDQAAIITAKAAEPSRVISARIQRARHIQQNRKYDTDGSCNAHLSTKDIQKYCKINNETARIAADAMRNLDLSARAYSRILKVARTIADLDSSPSIETSHFTEALQYRPRISQSKTGHLANAQTIA